LGLIQDLTERAVEFRSIADEDFSEFIKDETEGYARTVARNFKRGLEEARTMAQQQVKGLLKDGSKTKGHLVLQVLDKGTGEVVGHLWVHADEDRKRAFLYDIVVFERFRGKGYGRSIMILLEATLKQMGMQTVELHVFSENSVALSLYKKQGYNTVSCNMLKELK